MERWSWESTLHHFRTHVWLILDYFSLVCFNNRQFDRVANINAFLSDRSASPHILNWMKQPVAAFRSLWQRHTWANLVLLNTIITGNGRFSASRVIIPPSYPQRNKEFIKTVPATKGSVRTNIFIDKNPHKWINFPDRCVFKMVYRLVTVPFLVHLHRPKSPEDRVHPLVLSFEDTSVAPFSSSEATNWNHLLISLQQNI